MSPAKVKDTQMKAIVYLEREPVLQLKEEKPRDNNSLIEVQAAS